MADIKIAGRIKAGTADNIAGYASEILFDDEASNKTVKEKLEGKQDTLTFDNVPTANSNNPVKSGGVYQAIQDIDVSSQISGKADKSEMSVVAGTGANADKTTITLKNGTSATVLTQHQDISGKEDKSNKVTSFSSPTDTQYPSAKLVNDQLATKQDVISELSDIMSGAALGATAYQMPGTGIPPTDLASAVQTSLGKADTAIQSLTVGTTTTGAAGTNASVTNTGTATEPVLSFTIPQGAQGIQGIQGPQGERGPQGNTGVQVDSVASIIHSIDPTATYAAADVAGADAVQDVLAEVTELGGKLALGAVYDVSAENPTAGPNSDGKWETLSTLLSDANLNTLIPTALRKGGMSIKFVQSSDNKYVQFRYMLNYENTTAGNAAFVNAANWQGVDTEPTEDSHNLIESGAVARNLSVVNFEGNGDTLSESPIIENVVGGHTYRFWLKEPNIDMHDVTTRNAGDVRLCLRYLKADGTKTDLIRIGCNTIPSALNEYYDFEIPSDAVSLQAFGRCGTGYISRIIVEDITVVSNELYIEKEKSRSEVLADYEIVESGKVLLRVSNYIGQNVSQIPLGINANTTIVKIPISGYLSIKFRMYGSSQGNGSVIVDSNGVVLSAYSAPSGYITTIQPPANAAYFYYSVGNVEDYIFGYLLPKFTDIYEKIDILNGRITPDFRIQASNSCAVKPSLLQGKVSGNSVISNNKYVTTTAIFGNFYVELNDGYVIYQCSLVNRNGDIITDNYLSPINHNGADATVGRKSYGALQAVSELGFLVTICASDGSDVSEDDCIIKKFSWINDSLYTREIPANSAAYWAAWKRSRIIQKAVFTPLSKLPARGSLNPYFYLQNKKYIGIPYSGARQYDKFVGVDVLVKTFLTALQNPKSLIYSENLRTGEHTSGYGFTYEDDSEACTFYGVVCSAFTAFVLGLDIVYPSNMQASIPNMSKIDNFTVSDIQPMDVIVTQGHVSIITDILKDKSGEVKYICWAEATTPLTRITPYTPTELMARYNREKGDEATYASGLYRYGNLSSLSVENWENLVEIEDDDYVRGIDYNEDICTFAGDYAAFLEGQTIYINAKPKTIYTKLVVKKEGGGSQTVDITSLTPDSNGYVDVNITSLNLDDGMYEAELHNANDSVVSASTHFEILKADVSVTSSGTTRNVTFNYGHGNPYAVCVATKNGVIYYAKYLSSSEIENKSANFTYADGSKQIKLYVKGTYGIVAGLVNIT